MLPSSVDHRLVLSRRPTPLHTLDERGGQQAWPPQRYHCRWTNKHLRGRVTRTNKNQGIPETSDRGKLILYGQTCRNTRYFPLPSYIPSSCKAISSLKSLFARMSVFASLARASKAYARMRSGSIVPPENVRRRSHNV